MVLIKTLLMNCKKKKNRYGLLNKNYQGMSKNQLQAINLVFEKFFDESYKQFNLSEENTT